MLAFYKILQLVGKSRDNSAESFCSAFIIEKHKYTFGRFFADNTLARAVKVSYGNFKQGASPFFGTGSVGVGIFACRNEKNNPSAPFGVFCVCKAAFRGEFITLAVVLWRYFSSEKCLVLLIGYISDVSAVVAGSGASVVGYFSFGQ